MWRRRGGVGHCQPPAPAQSPPGLSRQPDPLEYDLPPFQEHNPRWLKPASSFVYLVVCALDNWSPAQSWKWSKTATTLATSGGMKLAALDRLPRRAAPRKGSALSGCGVTAGKLPVSRCSCMWNSVCREPPNCEVACCYTLLLHAAAASSRELSRRITASVSELQRVSRSTVTCFSWHLWRPSYLCWSEGRTVNPLVVVNKTKQKQTNEFKSRCHSEHKHALIRPCYRNLSLAVTSFLVTCQWVWKYQTPRDEPGASRRCKLQAHIRIHNNLRGKHDMRVEVPLERLTSATPPPSPP